MSAAALLKGFDFLLETIAHAVWSGLDMAAIKETQSSIRLLFVRQSDKSHLGIAISDS